MCSGESTVPTIVSSSRRPLSTATMRSPAASRLALANASLTATSCRASGCGNLPVSSRRRCSAGRPGGGSDSTRAETGAATPSTLRGTSNAKRVSTPATPSMRPSSAVAPSGARVRRDEDVGEARRLVELGARRAGGSGTCRTKPPSIATPHATTAAMLAICHRRVHRSRPSLRARTLTSRAPAA